jgi:hypothetical protein
LRLLFCEIEKDIHYNYNFVLGTLWFGWITRHDEFSIDEKIIYKTAAEANTQWRIGGGVDCFKMDEWLLVGVMQQLFLSRSFIDPILEII